MQARHRAQVFTGHSGPPPVDAGWRSLAVHVLVRAAKDVMGTDPWEQERALDWLNSTEGRDVARALGVHWDRPLTVDDLRKRERNVYFRGD